MGRQKAAVITGDIINSSALSNAQRKKLQTRLQQFFTGCAEEYPDFKYAQFRGDSLQIQLTRSRKAVLHMALLLHSYLFINSFSIRLGIGIGDIRYQSSSVSLSDGPAFQLSGPLTDELRKTGEVIGITATDAAFAAEWQVHSATLNYLLSRISDPQANAVYLQLQDLSQTQIAAVLRISQPSVHQRLQACGWNVIHQILLRFEAAVPAL
ncbi:SatD family protein [Deminuibacter soli]|uniref:Uncharacterized protein n=1 Tax=Deminuibacter soli TaxID=2291815 RepID=A0A3E1NM58_9BACT|nr:SatD family protein [Deminuibacter soli]RFM29005.1 hypothetical protein DXN05_09585 [Deminuibacter soli]